MLVAKVANFNYFNSQVTLRLTLAKAEEMGKRWVLLGITSRHNLIVGWKHPTTQKIQVSEPNLLSQLLHFIKLFVHAFLVD